MTALADVLAASIKERLAEHGYAMSSDTASDIAAHQAEAVAAAGLAVIQLPEPDDDDTWEYSGAEAGWSIPSDDEVDMVYACRDETVEFGWDRYEADDARAVAAALLAAAAAAEAVTA